MIYVSVRVFVLRLFVEVFLLLCVVADCDSCVGVCCIMCVCVYVFLCVCVCALLLLLLLLRSCLNLCLRFVCCLLRVGCVSLLYDRVLWVFVLCLLVVVLFVLCCCCLWLLRLRLSHVACVSLLLGGGVSCVACSNMFRVCFVACCGVAYFVCYCVLLLCLLLLLFTFLLFPIF